MKRADVAIIGGGIVGLSVAYQITELAPHLRLILIEKEMSIAAHQTGRNSGVIHSGIYYKPGSRKAETCRLGRAQLLRFCKEEGVPYEVCGKLIVATTEEEESRLPGLMERAALNGLHCQRLDGAGLREVEPFATGRAALYVRDTGIVDYRYFCERLFSKLRERGHEVLLGTRFLDRVDDGDHAGTLLLTSAGEIHTTLTISCAGLQSDRVAHKLGQDQTLPIIPFRGEYYRFVESAPRLVRNLIYPVPDPRFPFLGVHFTRMIDGALECGPNAVLALAREGYNKFDVDLRDVWATLSHRGFRRFARRHWDTGLGELWRSLSKAAFVKSLQRLVPAVEAAHLEPAPCGIRAQALTAEGELYDDFLILEETGRTKNIINVCNAPSPAATASLAIGEHIAERALLRIEQIGPGRSLRREITSTFGSGFGRAQEAAVKIADKP